MKRNEAERNCKYCHFLRCNVAKKKLWCKLKQLLEKSYYYSGEWIEREDFNKAKTCDLYFEDS